MSHHRNPRALLTPVMRQVLERMARAGRAPLHALTPDQARAAYEAGAGVLELAPHKLARVEDLHFTARDGHPLPARLYAPEQPALDRPALPVLLYLHGGGFTVGSIATHDVLCRHLSHLAHCAVVSVDYRLAPQHNFQPPPLTPGTASTLCTARPQRWDWMPPGWPSAATVPAARWPRSRP
jgi:acetyl esterase